MRWAPLLSIAVLAGCASVPAVPPPGPTAAFAQVATVGAVRVTPLSLVEDSRCPERVHCVWAGRLRIQALIQFHGGSEELRTEMILGEPITLPEGKLTLAEAVPGTRPGERIGPSAYRFTFALSP